jgi:hypothetical protein
MSVWQPTWYKVTTPKFLLNLKTNQTSLKCRQRGGSGQTMIVWYIPCSVCSTFYLGRKNTVVWFTVLLLGLWRRRSEKTIIKTRFLAYLTEGGGAIQEIISESFYRNILDR